MFVNVLCMQSYLAVTMKSEAAMCCKGEAVPEDILKDASKLPGHQVNTIQTAEGSPEKILISVKGKVTKVEAATQQTVNNKKMPLQNITIKDKSGKIKVAIWDEMVGQINKGQLISLTNTFTSNDIFDVSEDESDEEAVPVESGMLNGVLQGVVECDVYLSCSKSACSNTKLVTVKCDDDIYRMSCKSCYNMLMGSACNNYLRCIMMLDHEGTHKKVVVFAPHIKKIFESKGLDSTILDDRNEMIMKVMDVLPIDIKFKLNNNTIKDIVCKRVA